MWWPSDPCVCMYRDDFISQPLLIARMQEERPPLAVARIDHDFAVAADGSHRLSKIHIYLVQDLD